MSDSEPTFPGMSVQRITPTDSLDVAHTHAVIFRNGSSAVILDASGTYRVGPVLADGSVEPSAGEFWAADRSDADVRDAVRYMKSLSDE